MTAGNGKRETGSGKFVRVFKKKIDLADLLDSCATSGWPNISLTRALTNVTPGNVSTFPNPPSWLERTRDITYTKRTNKTKRLSRDARRKKKEPPFLTHDLRGFPFAIRARCVEERHFGRSVRRLQHRLLTLRHKRFQKKKSSGITTFLIRTYRQYTRFVRGLNDVNGIHVYRAVKRSPVVDTQQD